MPDLLTPSKESMIFDDEYLYVCLASYPITKGHTIIVWKGKVKDIHSLGRKDYVHLMWVVEKTRDSLLKTLNLEKVYMMYLDEIQHVHWHLIPRYEERGYNLLKHSPKLNMNFEFVKPIKKNLKV